MSIGKLLNLLRGRRRRLEGDLDRELRYHVDRRVEEVMKTGASAAEARRLVHLELGGVTQVREAVRETWVWRWLDTLGADLRYAVRSLRKSWGFALGTIAVLAIGIGANTAIFSVVNAVLLRPLAYPDAGRLVSVETLWTKTGRVSPEIAGRDFLELQAQPGLFEAMGHFAGEDDLATQVNGQPEFANVQDVPRFCSSC
jgi:MacB-like periplasmic core domain